MYNQNYNQGGYQPNGYSQPSAGNGKQRKERINEVHCIGVVKGLTDQDTQLKITTFENGNHGMLFKIVTTEPDGADKNGQPKVHHETFNVAVTTNKSITLELLQSIKVGSKILVVGPFRTRSYPDKTGQMRSTREIKPFFIQYLAEPMQPTQQPYGQPYGQQAPQYNPQPAYPQPYGPGGYPQQQMPPQYPQGPQPQQAPPYYQAPQQPAYTPQGGYAPQQPQPQQQAPQYVPNQQPSQYAQRPQGGYAPGAPAAAPVPSAQYGPEDDLPPDDVLQGKNIAL